MNLTIPANLPQDKIEAIQKIINSATELSDEEIVKPLEEGYVLSFDDNGEPRPKLLANCILTQEYRREAARRFLVFDAVADATDSNEQEARRRKCKLVMKRLNGEWEPDWKNTWQHKFSIGCDPSGSLFVLDVFNAYSEFVFKDRATANRFIRLCGDDIKTLWGIA